MANGRQRTLSRQVSLACFVFAVLQAVSGGAVSSSEAGFDPIHDFGYLEMPDGTRIAYSLYRPDGERRYPVAMTYNPYVGGGLRIEIGIGGARETERFLLHGYAVLSVSLRGTGCSEGEFSILGDRHGEDGAEVVEWAAAQPWSTGRVGLWGNSYSGMTPYLVGAQRPPGLRAIAAGASTGDGYRDTVYPGGIFNSAQFAHWTFSTQPFASGLGVERRLAAGDEACRRLQEERGGRPTSLWAEFSTHRLLDEWWRSQSVVRRAARTTAPALVVHAWQDQQVGALAALDLFRALRGPRRLLVANGSHGFFNGDLAQTEVLRWFDQWLKDEDTGIASEPAVDVRLGVGDGGAAETLALDDWPPAVEPVTLWMTAAERLVETAEALAGEEGALSYLSNSATEAGYDAAAFSRVPAAWGALTYRGEPLEEALLVLGRPVVELRLESAGTDTDLMVVLHDVHPDGRVEYVQWGFLRASHRRLDEARSTPFDPVLGNDAELPLAPGEISDLTVGLQPVGHVFRPGHRIELVVAAPPPMQAAADHWGFDDLRDPVVNVVHHALQRPSRLHLPRPIGLTPPPLSAECGALDGQPCRPAEAQAPQSVVTRNR